MSKTVGLGETLGFPKSGGKKTTPETETTFSLISFNGGLTAVVVARSGLLLKRLHQRGLCGISHVIVDEAGGLACDFGVKM